MTNIKTGKRNLISDVNGISVGNITDQNLKSGVTAIVCDEPTIASVHVMGGAPGTRDTDLLSPENVVDHVDGFVLSGGSGFGIDAGAGAMAAMQKAGRGFQIGDVRVPIVPSAILFDLLNGGDKNWGKYPPYREMGFAAVEAADVEFELGSVGAGTGALAANCKGGLGSASTILTFEDGQQITIQRRMAWVNSPRKPVMARNRQPLSLAGGQNRISGYHRNGGIGARFLCLAAFNA